jgi:hypothetical protein
VIKAPGHWKASRFGEGEKGVEAQANFDELALSSYGSPETDGAYRVRHYVITATLFPSVESAQDFCTKYMGGQAGMDKIGGTDAAAIKPQMMAATVSYSMRPPEKWFSASLNHMVPKEFAEMLDEDAVKLLFPPSILEKIQGHQTKAMKISMTDNVKQIMMAEVRKYHGVVISEKNEELLEMHKLVPGRTILPYNLEYVMAVKVKCDLGIQVRTLRG